MVAALAAWGCHSEPAVIPFFGADSAHAAGAETRLTFAGKNKYGFPFQALSVGWAEDGTGIVYTFSPRPSQPNEDTGLRCVGSQTCTQVPRDSLDTCVAMLPPNGGSAYWNVCETRHPPTDSLDILFAAGVSQTGQLLYAE